MEPTQPQQPISIDYLNQIAPQAPKKKMPLSRIQLIIVGIVAVAFIIIMILVAAVGGGSTKSLQQLAARLQSTEKIASSASTLIKNTQLSALNSNLKIYLTNTNRDIAAPLLKDNIDVTKLDKTIVANAAGTDVTVRLEDARLNAVYDSTYAREMAYRLDTIVSLMSQIEHSTSNSGLKLFLDNALTNLLPTQKAFADFNAADG
jgi:hypothetical protein